MAGVKGRSGPPGNLNGCRRPWAAFWRRRALRPQDRWAAGLAARYEAELLADRPDPSATERRLIELAALARGCSVLILSALSEAGITRRVDGAVETMPAVRELGRFVLAEQRCVQTLGLERRAKPVPSLEDYLSGARKPEPFEAEQEGPREDAS